ncbi:MAG: 16S rRNA (cytidine(1402)-2'-O)-methyltransferase [Deltaproteobacteria bacterium]|nr:16S rRNA (cytidine(1402)-2'-O)-methyltransferase [Deltaproteobacteria bacterium]
MSGRLYVVATPIGNLEDLGLRALRVLKEVAVIACEDTRVSRKLLDHYGVGTSVTSLHAHSAAEAIERLLDRVERGEDAALISDAGTPLVSDPGEALIAGAIARGLEVVPIPGPSALLAALVAGGVSCSRFVFLGFLPRDDAERRELLAPYRALGVALVIYESPHRVGETLASLARTFGDRRAVVARELTKRFESFDRDRLEALAARYRQEEPRGEVVIVVGPSEDGPTPRRDADVDEEIRRLLEAGTSPADAARLVAGAFGLARKEAYRRVLEVKKGR